MVDKNKLINKLKSDLDIYNVKFNKKSVVRYINYLLQDIKRNKFKK